MTYLNAPWLLSTPLQLLFDAFEKEGATLRLVGGSVRDGLLDLPVSDMDLAVDRDPHWVLNLLQAHHIKAIPTGIDHGTITAILEKKPYQITTLRVDVTTFGRKAQVAFTEDWHQDAERRDFTINAIYADREGLLFDPVGGVNDLKNRVVRFIGKAEDRLQEDYLRLLRFFRFSARFGHEPYDKEGLTACAKYASSLPCLARERVTEEFLKILELANPVYALRAMKETGVLSHIVPFHQDEFIRPLVILEKESGAPPSACLRLASLRPAVQDSQQYLRLSGKQQSDLEFFLTPHSPVTATSFKDLAYRWGKEKIFNLSLLQTAQHLASSQISLTASVAFLKELHHLFDPWAVPLFPLSGRDVLNHGITEGQQVGTFLKAVETWWISQDFQPNHEECVAYLKTLL